MDDIKNNQEYSEEEDILEAKKVKKIQRERQIRKGRMWQERIRGIFRFFASIGIIILLVFLADLPQWYLAKSSFKIYNPDNVAIVGNKIVPTAKIFKTLYDIEVPNIPIYLFRTGEIRAKIRELSPIDEVYIRRYAFPARLDIIVREKIPSVVIAPDEKVKPVAFFTKDGTLVGREYLPLPAEYKTIKLLSYGNKGDDYHNWNKEKIQKIEKIVRYIETYSKEPVLYLDFRNPNDIYAEIKTVKIRLGKLDDTVFERIERIPSILPQVKLMDTKIKYLDLSWEKVNYLKLDE